MAKINMLAMGAYSRGLLKIFSSRMGAHMRGAFSRGEANSRIYGMKHLQVLPVDKLTQDRYNFGFQTILHAISMFYAI